MERTIMKRAAIYCRVSTIEQVQKGYSLEYQQCFLPELARKRGFIVEQEDIYSEALSGANDRRPEYNRMLAKVIQGQYQAVFVTEKSRLSRTDNRREEERIVKAMQSCGCVVVTPHTVYDPGSVDGEFIWDILSAVDRHERKRIKARVARVKFSKSSQGGYSGGGIPTGYVRCWDEELGKPYFKIDELSMQPVKLAFQWILEGILITQIANRLNDLGYRTIKNKKFQNKGIKYWLCNPQYAGYTVLGKSLVAMLSSRHVFEKNQFLEPIVSKHTFAKVQSILGKRSNVFNDQRRLTNRHPLASILTCPRCNNKMGFRKNYNIPNRNENLWYYQCQTRHKASLRRSAPAQTIPYHLAHQLVGKLIHQLSEFGYSVDQNEVEKLMCCIKDMSQTEVLQEEKIAQLKMIFSNYFKKVEFSREGSNYHNHRYVITKFITQKNEVFIMTENGKIERLLAL